MGDLDKLHQVYKNARLKYLNVRRDAEEALIAEMVDRMRGFEANGIAMEVRITELEARLGPVGEKELPGLPDRMAAARAAKAAKREAEAAPGAA